MQDADRLTSELAVDECPYRENPSAEGDSAECRLLRHIFGFNVQAFTVVRRDACEVCCRSDFPTPQRYNSVIASLVYSGAQRLIDEGGQPACDAERAQKLRNSAVSELVRTTLGTPCGQDPSKDGSALRTRLHSCDVIVCCTDASDQTVTAVESAVNQEGVRCFVHVVDDGGGASEILPRFQGHDAVFVHRNSNRIGEFATLNRLLPALRARYVALQDPRSVSRPERLKWTVGLLERRGSEIAATAVETPRGKSIPQELACDSDSALPWQSLVVRRTTLLDMQRMHGGVENHVALIQRAANDDRQFSLGSRVTVDVRHESNSTVTAAASTARSGFGGSRNEPRPAVDVVLPFHNTIGFVNESLRSVLAQSGVDVVVHLIDDASTVDTSPHLGRWSRDPRVRVYRNSRNLGPYVSFNNVSRFFETDFVAVQDADDISLPHRLRVAVASLRAAGADIFGAAVEMFGDDSEHSSRTEAMRPVAPIRYSRYPATDRVPSVINGSAVMRTTEFIRLGGFADYGSSESNLCGLDSEFYTRAKFFGCHFFISQDVVLKCRRHAQSSTQNSETGWGTARRRLAGERVLERIAVWRKYEFDPRDFGGLGRYGMLTERLT